MDKPITVTFSFGLHEMDKAVALLAYADKHGILSNHPAAPPAAQPPGMPPTPAPKGKSPTPAAAAKIATNSKAKPASPAKANPKQDDILDLHGDNDDDDETGGLDLADADNGDGFNGTAEEAKEEALGILRTMLGNGMKSQVKEIQQIMQVAKFHDVPVEQGFDFLAAVKKVEARIAKN